MEEGLDEKRYRQRAEHPDKALYPQFPGQGQLFAAKCCRNNFRKGRGDRQSGEGVLKVKSQLGDDNMVPPYPCGYLENGVASIKGSPEIPSQGQGMGRESLLLSLSCCPSPTFLSSCQVIKDGMTADFSAGQGYLY